MGAMGVGTHTHTSLVEWNIVYACACMCVIAWLCMDEWAASKGEEEETEEKQIETLDSEPTALNFTVFMAIDVF